MKTMVCCIRTSINGIKSLHEGRRGGYERMYVCTYVCVCGGGEHIHNREKGLAMGGGDIAHKKERAVGACAVVGKGLNFCVCESTVCAYFIRGERGIYCTVLWLVAQPFFILYS